MINKELNIPISFHKELRGLNMGKYQGLFFNDFLKEKEVIEAFNDYNKPIPRGESINQLNNRLFSFIKKIVCECPYKNIAIVSHGTAIGSIKAYVSEDSYIHIDKCILLYKNNVFKVIGSSVY
jgi:broad specificity phosphatase PhoE